MFNPVILAALWIPLFLPGAISPVSPADSGGLTVSGTCSTNPGADGDYGTADDAYTNTVVAVTEPGSEYPLDAQGDACWLSVDPPVPAVGADTTVGGSDRVASSPPLVPVDMMIICGLAAAIAASGMLVMWPIRARRLTSQ